MTPFGQLRRQDPRILTSHKAFGKQIFGFVPQIIFAGPVLVHSWPSRCFRIIRFTTIPFSHYTNLYRISCASLILSYLPTHFAATCQKRCRIASLLGVSKFGRRTEFLSIPSSTSFVSAQTSGTTTIPKPNNFEDKRIRLL